MRITKKAIESAPRYILGVDYRAAYKPMTIDLFALEAGNICEAMHDGDGRYDVEKVWCLCLYERTDDVEDGYIRYRERMISYDQYLWKAAPTESHCCVWYGISDRKPCFYDQRVIDRG